MNVINMNKFKTNIFKIFISVKVLTVGAEHVLPPVCPYDSELFGALALYDRD